MGVRRRLAGAAVALAAVLTAPLAGCAVDYGTAAYVGPADELRLGYFANVTHAPAVAGVARGTFAEHLGGTDLSVQVFTAGPAAIEALNAQAVDAVFIGPNPAINGFIRSEGQALRVVSGLASGGAQLVVRDGIGTVEDLRGTELATPQLGGTQDVALRAWLGDNGLATTLSGRGDVAITPTSGAQTLQLFRDDRIDGAWLPEPWASRLVVEAGAQVLLDEADLWEDGAFPTTLLIVSARFLTEHPETVEALVRGTVEAVDWAEANREDAAAVVNEEITRVTGAPLQERVLERAFANITFTTDPVAHTLPELLGDAVRVGTAPDAPVEGIYDLRLLNQVLTSDGRPAVSTAGLGQE
ncbi:ABC transporter substrate-binding protein [Cellulomonas bogoriensis]|uniref:Sulfonate ABC transporter substrate-binding protein n=1 Tax=Cellulomonas bogoriensis 69B4 = DSM 16987 TaxID=1386082 RepID=A0A0A0BY08_9CELL|nr:ABC transporter substrate-binding protein [Cellulomonas bogoriensis]KGM12850.1 sulfonate ABC transporter substrate-binding protein [Cellulomonas bogoriensis 69B4 = DSM 16987]